MRGATPGGSDNKNAPIISIFKFKPGLKMEEIVAVWDEYKGNELPGAASGEGIDFVVALCATPAQSAYHIIICSSSLLLI